MRYYPVNLDIRNRNCIVVGGGAVGTRKVKTLLDCGAKVTVVSPVVTKALHELSNNGSIKLERKVLSSPQILTECFWLSAQQTNRN